MPAGQPVGNVPNKDVKPTVEASATETDDKEAKKVSSKDGTSKDPEMDLDEGDLKELSESRKIPYNRFKEVNERAKTLEQQIAGMQTSKEAEISRAIQDAEIRIKAQLEKDREDDDLLTSSEPWERDSKHLESQVVALTQKLDALQGSQERSNLESQMTRLKSSYPKADEMAVLGWKKTQPHASLDELMQLSHDRTVQSAEATIKEILDRKKAKAKEQILVPVGSQRFRLTDDEKPKTLPEADAAIKKFLAERQ